MLFGTEPSSYTPYTTQKCLNALLYLCTRQAQKPSAVAVKGILTAFQNRLVKGNLIGEDLMRMSQWLICEGHTKYLSIGMTSI